MDVDAALNLWMRKKLTEELYDLDPGFKLHEDSNGCVVTFYDIEFGKGWTGSCETCYYEYEAVLYSADCTCPDQVPGVKNPDKLRKNPNKFKFFQHDLMVYEPMSLATIVNELLELNP